MGTQYLQDKVSATVWPWQTLKIKQKKDFPSLKYSLVILLIAWGIGTVMWLIGHTNIAMVAFCVSTIVFVISRLFPAGYAVVEMSFKRLSSIIGLSLTWLLLIPFFYVCFPLGRVVQIFKGKDPMQRSLDLETSSYWIKCPGKSSLKDYKRQF